MSVEAIAAKNAPVIAPLTLAALFGNETILEITAVCAGIALGAMWRAANLRSEGKTWSDVRSDLVISILVAGANAVLAFTLVQWLDVSRSMAMGIGVLVGATGLRAVPEAKDVLVGALRRKLIGDDIVMINPPAQAKINEAMDKLRDTDVV